MCGSDEHHPHPERSSPTRLSTSEHASYKGRSCIIITWAPKSRRMRWAVRLLRTGQQSKTCGVLVGKPEVRRPQWMMTEIEWNRMDWVNLA